MYDYLFISEQMLSLLAVLCFYFIDHYSRYQHKKWQDPQFETPSHSARINRVLLTAAIVLLGLAFLSSQIFTILYASGISELEPLIFMGGTVRFILFLMLWSGWFNILFVLMILTYFKLKPGERYPVLHKMMLIVGGLVVTLAGLKVLAYFISLKSLLIPGLNRPAHSVTAGGFIAPAELFILALLLVIFSFSYRLLRSKRKNLYYSVYLVVNLLLFLFLLIPYYQLATLLFNVNLPSSAGVSGFTFESYYVLLVLGFLFGSAVISVIMAGVYIALSDKMLVPSFGRAYALKYAAINFLTVLLLSMLPIYPLLIKTVFS